MSHRTRRIVALACALAAMTGADAVHAEEPKVECTDHCYVLEQLVVRADAKHHTARFTLTGQVFAATPQIIPLLGPSSSVGLTDAKVNGQRAAIGFEDDAWYLRTGEKRFTLTGTLRLPEDGVLSVKGPINAVDVSAAGGYVEEGNHFGASTDLGLTFTVGDRPKDDDVATSAPVVVPTQASFARLVVVGSRTTFERRVKVTGPAELAPQTIPLASGEKVTEVIGARYTETAGAITLQLVGPAADVTIRGTITDDHATFSAASRDEVVLVATDDDHELTTTGSWDALPAASTVFASELAKVPSMRAFDVRGSRTLALSIKKRSMRDVLAAVVDHHRRTAVWSGSGELVAVDTFAYDNGALDVFKLRSRGRPIYLAIDGGRLPMLHEDDEPVDQLNVPLPSGRHDLKVQTLDHHDMHGLFGRLAIAMPDHGLTESTATLTLGLPSNVHPVYVTGGDDRQRFYGAPRHLLGFGLALGVAFLVFARGRSRALATAAGFGAFCLAPGAFAGGAALAVGLMLVRANAVRMPTRRLRVALACGGVAASVLVAGLSARLASETTPSSAGAALVASATSATSDDDRRVIDLRPHPTLDATARATTSGARAITPVELPMPEAARTLMVQRTLVTRDRPFTPTIVYVTDAFFVLAGALWLACLLGLGWLHRDGLRAARRKLHELVTPTPAPLAHATPMPPAPPYRT